MKTLTAIIADFCIVFLVWVASTKLTSGWLVFIVVLGMVGIASLTNALITATAEDSEEKKVKATVDDVRK